MTEVRSKGLGMGAEHLGLDALLARVEAAPAPLQPTASEQSEADPARIQYIGLSALEPGRYQPRGSMDEASLIELSNSLRQHGMMQPIVVRALEDKRFEIIAGERRWRAAKLANLQLVPVVVHDLSDNEAMVLSLVENVQRVDLNVVDQARALQRLTSEQGITHQQAADLVGKSRGYVSNLLRLLSLEPSVLASLASSEIEMGHARALLSLSPEDQVAFVASILRGGWSVRVTEERVRLHNSGTDKHKEEDEPTGPSESLCHQWMSTLTHRFSVPVMIKPTRGSEGGKVVLNYRSQDELKRLYDLLLEGE